MPASRLLFFNVSLETINTLSRTSEKPQKRKPRKKNSISAVPCNMCVYTHIVETIGARISSWGHSRSNRPTDQIVVVTVARYCHCCVCIYTSRDMNKTLPRLVIGGRHGRDGQPPPVTAPVIQTDPLKASTASVFDYTHTLSRSDSKVNLRRHGSIRSLKRKTLLFSRSGDYSSTSTTHLFLDDRIYTTHLAC